MALKLKINKDDFEKLSDAIKSEYKESGGEYILDVSGLEDTSALKRAKDREAQAAKDLRLQVESLNEELNEIKTSDAYRKGSDIKTLEKSWQDKLNTAVKEVSEKLTGREKFIKESLIDAKAESIANKISTSPKLMIPHIKARLVADLEGEIPSTKILGDDGKISEMTLEQLEQSFIANKDYSPIIKGSMSSGGSTSGNKLPSGSASKINVDEPKVDLSSIKPSALAERIKSQKEADVNK